MYLFTAYMQKQSLKHMLYIKVSIDINKYQ